MRSAARNTLSAEYVLGLMLQDGRYWAQSDLHEDHYCIFCGEWRGTPHHEECPIRLANWYFMNKDSEA